MGKEQTENERKYLIIANDLGQNHLTQTQILPSWIISTTHQGKQQKPKSKQNFSQLAKKKKTSGLISYYSPWDPGDIFPGIKLAMFDLPRHCPSKSWNNPDPVKHTVSAFSSQALPLKPVSAEQ